MRQEPLNGCCRSDSPVILVSTDWPKTGTTVNSAVKLGTVEKYIESILTKLTQQSRTGAALKAVQLEYILLPRMPSRDPITNVTDEQVAAEKHAQAAIDCLGRK